MTRTAIRHTLSILTAAILVSAFASGPAAAQTQIDPPSLQLNAGSANTTSRYKAWHTSNFRMEFGDLPSKPKIPNGLAAKKGSHSMAKPHPSTGLTSPVGFDQGLFR